MPKLTSVDPKGPSDWDKDAIKEENKVLIGRIRDLQRVLYADGKKSLLLILQGVDASGKDGTVGKIFGGVNPLGCRVYAFKKPTEVEMA